MKFTIEEVQAGAEQEATETREWLKALQERAAIVAEEPEKPSMNKGDIALAKAEGAAQHVSEPKDYLDIAIAFRTALRGLKLGHRVYYDAQLERATYVLEGVFNEARRRMFSNKDLPEHADVTWQSAIRAPYGTTGYADDVIARRMGIDSVDQPAEYFMDVLFNDSIMECYVSSRADLLMVYPLDGEPWIAGVTDIVDRDKMRFVRKRLGAWLSAKGISDDRVREIVEQHKTLTATGSYRVFPNDIQWERVYTTVCTVGSCMSDECYSGDDHPVNAYSAAYYGSGDNGLAIILPEHGGGRGILNTRSGTIVRWYGKHCDINALARVGITVDSDALADSWLALIESGSYFVAPYVDGDNDWGTVKGNRVLLDSSGVTELDNTGGEYYVGKLVTCEYSDEQYPEDQCTWLDGQEVWVNNEYDHRWGTCAATGLDWLHGRMHKVTYEGSLCWVSADAMESGEIWEDANGIYWHESKHTPVEVDGSLYRESECVQKKDGSWILECDYVEEEDEAA